MSSQLTVSAWEARQLHLRGWLRSKKGKWRKGSSPRTHTKWEALVKEGIRQPAGSVPAAAANDPRLPYRGQSWHSETWRKTLAQLCGRKRTKVKMPRGKAAQAANNKKPKGQKKARRRRVASPVNLGGF